MAAADQAALELQLTISFRAMQRSRTTLEDFIQSYFPYLGLNPAKDVFKYLDILVWVEATIYQLDEDNESWAKQGQVYAGRKVLAESPIGPVLKSQGLLDDAIQHELDQGDVYWEGERRVCATLLAQGAPRDRTTPDSATTAHAPGSDDATAKLTLEDILRVHEAKSFDYRVLHLILRKLTHAAPNPTLLAFLRVDELLVDIGDDLTDYEDDVESNSFNILRAYVHLYGDKAPLKLIERISALESEHSTLLKQLPPDLQAHYWARHSDAVQEGGGEASGKWVFPPLILDEHRWRRHIRESGSGSDSGGSEGSRSRKRIRT